VSGFSGNRGTGVLLLLLGQLATLPRPTPTPVPAWPAEPADYRKIPLGLPYAQMEGRILLTGCRPNTREHESGRRTCDGNGFLSGGVTVEDVFLFQDDVFVGVVMSFPSDDYEKLRDIFEFKYGEPGRLQTTRVTTRAGTRYDNEILNWDGRKASVSLQRYGDSLEKGSATILLNSYVEQQERERRERLKRDADAF
jgi:hypothetical protein